MEKCWRLPRSIATLRISRRRWRWKVRLDAARSAPPLPHEAKPKASRPVTEQMACQDVSLAEVRREPPARSVAWKRERRFPGARDAADRRQDFARHPVHAAGRRQG